MLCFMHLLTHSLSLQFSRARNTIFASRSLTLLDSCRPALITPERFTHLTISSHRSSDLENTRTSRESHPASNSRGTVVKKQWYSFLRIQQDQPRCHQGAQGLLQRIRLSEACTGSSPCMPKETQSLSPTTSCQSGSKHMGVFGT